MTPEQEADKAFLEARIAECQPVIRQARIMQIGWAEGGDIEPFKTNLANVTALLGAWMATEKKWKSLLAELG